jgi:epoxyqueuosine reductase
LDVPWNGQASGRCPVGATCQFNRTCYRRGAGIKTVPCHRREFNPTPYNPAAGVHFRRFDGSATNIHPDNRRHEAKFIGKNRRVPLKSEELKAIAIAQGFDWAGICDAEPPRSWPRYEQWLSEGMHGEMSFMESSMEARKSPDSLLHGVQSILACALNYRTEASRRKDAPKVASYAYGRDYHKVIRKKLKRIALIVESHYPGLQTRPCVDSAPILDREYANRAGLGWFGKNSCLINSRRGSFFFIGLLLLSQRFEPDRPSIGGCGTCRACIDACPTGALQLRPNAKVAMLDSRKCISYLTIEKKSEFAQHEAQMLHGWLFGCDVCQDVCPFNRPSPRQPQRGHPTQEPDFAPRDQNVSPLTEFLVSCSKEEFDGLYRGSAVMRAGWVRMKRNALALTMRSKGPK